MTDRLLPSIEELLTRCRNDGELRIGARFWSGSLTFNVGEETLTLGFENGSPCAEAPESDDTIALSGPAEIWAPLLAPKPPRLMTDVMALLAADMVELQGEPKLVAQYYSALMRVIELLRPEADVSDEVIDESGPTARFDTPVGRYIHLDIDGQDYRIYFEEAGRGGIPLVLQHTAGAHGTQYRHLFENKTITDRFHLIAYDLPFHGKSVPPVGKNWWQDEYKLTGDFVRALPVELSRALELDRPVFMGCSVGGMLALDLAYHHPEVFSAVISLEGALKVAEIPQEWFDLLWHPQVSNEFKARCMLGTMSPTSPERYRKETAQIYAAGWPNSFIGDLNYYINDYDLRDKAQDIDTSQVAVHILSGEYDLSGTVELGREAHEAIKGSTFTEMAGIGHFAMSENPKVFMSYLEPVLAAIAEGRD